MPSSPQQSWFYDIYQKGMRIEVVPKEWREGLIVNLLKKGDKEEPGNYRGITLLSVVGKVFCKILNNRLVEHLDRERALHEGQAGYRKNKINAA